MTNWSKVRWFVHRRTYFCTAAVLEEDGIRLFPIGSLRVEPDGQARYFEIFARPVSPGAEISFLAVDMNPLFWLRSLWRGRFEHPPAIRLKATAGQRRAASPEEENQWFRRVGWLLKTKGGRMLWSRPGRVRELEITQAKPVKVAAMTNHLSNWLDP